LETEKVRVVVLEKIIMLDEVIVEIEKGTSVAVVIPFRINAVFFGHQNNTEFHSVKFHPAEYHHQYDCDVN
jgi:hypothetical protein